jgi:hypothetical protein
MNAVFTAMQEVVQQLRLGGNTERMDPEQLQDIASKLTWSGHYHVLLWDIKSLQDATAGRPGCLPAHAAGKHRQWMATTGSVTWLHGNPYRIQNSSGARLKQHRVNDSGTRCNLHDAFKCSN